MKLLERKRNFVRIYLTEKTYTQGNMRAIKGKTKSMTIYEATLEEVVLVIEEAIRAKGER